MEDFFQFENQAPRMQDVSLRSKNRICFALNRQEASLLEMQMQDEGWTNISGFIKSKLFANGAKTYEKKLRNAAEKDVLLIVKNLLLEFLKETQTASESYNKKVENLSDELAATGQEALLAKSNILRSWGADYNRTAQQLLKALVPIVSSFIRSEPGADACEEVLNELYPAAEGWTVESGTIEDREAAKNTARKVNQKS